MAVRKQKPKVRKTVADAKHYGTEPEITSASKPIDLINAYNWYNTFYTSDEAKDFIVTFFKSKKSADKNKQKKLLSLIQNLKSVDVRSVGWNCRILYNGGSLPEDIEKQTWDRLNKLVGSVVPEKKTEAPAPVISIKEHIETKVAELIGNLEEEVDKFVTDKKTDFNPSEWFMTKAVKPALAKKIGEFYAPLYAELFDAHAGKDTDLKDAYSHWTKPGLKKYMDFIKSILSAAETFSVVVKTTRAPRKKKEKPAAILVAKMKYQSKNDELKLESVKPTDIIGSSQLWTYNTKTRALAVYNAIGATGLSVKGTTLTGFDEKTSVVKKLRKPAESLQKLKDSGKIALRKIMEELTTKPSSANGRVNAETILVRIVK